MKPILVSTGEPAGIGPDLCMALANAKSPVVLLGNKSMLLERAQTLGLSIEMNDYHKDEELIGKPNHLTVLNQSLNAPVIPGQLNKENSQYVLNMLQEGVQRCLNKEFSALVTAPVHKAIINEAGFDFTGHTELLAQLCHVEQVVMMLASKLMKVALVTTHLPLKQVPEAITQSRLKKVLHCINQALINEFNVQQPKIYIAGLNPHAGEGGYLGREEIEVINPVVHQLNKEGMNIIGPLPADTMFSEANCENADAFVAMYHDQGLPVLKHGSFGHAVNITLGLPIIRTSVDHGTACELAGRGQASATSLLLAVEYATKMARNRALKNG